MDLVPPIVSLGAHDIDVAVAPLVGLFALPEKIAIAAADPAQLEQAVQEMPDEVDGVRWRGGAAGVRKTEVCEIGAFLRDLSGFDTRPETAQQWLPYITHARFGVRRWTEQLFDAGQGQVFAQ